MNVTADPPRPDPLYWETLESVVFEIQRQRPDGPVTRADLISVILRHHLPADAHADQLLERFQADGMIRAAGAGWQIDAGTVDRALSFDVRHAWEIERVRELLNCYWQATDGGLGNETRAVLAAALFDLRRAHTDPAALWDLGPDAIEQVLAEADLPDLLTETTLAAPHCPEPVLRRA